MLWCVHLLYLCLCLCACENQPWGKSFPLRKLLRRRCLIYLNLLKLKVSFLFPKFLLTWAQFLSDNWNKIQMLIYIKKKNNLQLSLVPPGLTYFFLFYVFLRFYGDECSKQAKYENVFKLRKAFIGLIQSDRPFHKSQHVHDIWLYCLHIRSSWGVLPDLNKYPILARLLDLHDVLSQSVVEIQFTFLEV